MARRRIGTVRLIANRKIRGGMNRSKAFKSAWRTVKKKNLWD